MARAPARRTGAVTVALRPFDDADASWLDAWLGAVAAGVGYEAPADRAGVWLGQRLQHERSLRARILERDGERAGLLVYRLNAPRRGCALIEIVATPAAEARRGSGMSAAAAIENEMRDAGVRRIHAPAPAMHGIAMYFWIRLGYRPLLRHDWPCESDGVAWLARDL